MKRFIIILCLWFGCHQPLFGWQQHDLVTSLALQEVAWLDTYASIPVTSFQQLLSKAFSKNFSEKDFLRQYQLNESYKIAFKSPDDTHMGKFPTPGEKTSARDILVHYADEPDWGMDQNLNISPDQPYMGGTVGPTSQAFRHLFLKKWTLSAPFRTFHVPPRQMGEAPERAQIYYTLAQTAFEAKEPYWAFRFLSWALHYIEDLGQPFHSSQLLTPKFVSWENIFDFKKSVKRTTQIIANYHFIYEEYVAYRIQKELKEKKETLFSGALRGQPFKQSSSAFLIAQHQADASSRAAFDIGETSILFFGKKFFDEAIDVPNSPVGTFSVEKFDALKKISSLEQKHKDLFFKRTRESLEKTGLYVRSLLELAKEEFLR